MKISAAACSLGVMFVLAISALHGSGFGSFSEEMNASNASPFLKQMFPILYAMPSLYLLVLAAFGIFALLSPASRRGVCFILSVAVFAAGALALIVGEWLPMVVMGLGGLLFAASAVTVSQSR